DINVTGVQTCALPICQEYNLSYNTKTEKSDTYASVGYLNDDGYMIKTDFERYSGRLNYNVYPTKWFKTGLNLGVTRTVSNYSTSDRKSVVRERVWICV